MRKFLALFLALLCIFPVLALPLSAAGTTGEKIYVRDLSQTTVDQDLIGSVYCSSSGSVTEIETKEDIAYTYPAASTGDPQVVSFIEAGYVSSKGKSSPFELYVYIYCPQKSQHYAKTIDLCVNYDMTFVEGEGETADPKEWQAKDYKTYELEFMKSQSSNGTVKKYRVKDLDIKSMTNYRLGVRKYDIVNVNCLCRDMKKVTSFSVGQSYTITGSMYEGDYQVETSAIDVLTINDIHQTHFRYANKANTNYMTQINSVYFSVSDEDIARWGDLCSIKSSYWRERTTPMVVTNDDELWNGLKDYIGQNVTKLSEQPEYSIYLSNYVINSGMTSFTESYNYEWSYNRHEDDKPKGSSTGYEDVNILWWLFYSEAEELADANVSTGDVLTRFQEYCDKIISNLQGDETPRDHEIMELNNLVMSYAKARAETGFKYGEQELTIYAKDTQDEYLQGYKYNSGFHKWWSELIGDDNYDTESLNGVHSIQLLDHKAVSALTTADKETISKQYLISEDEVVAFQKFCVEADNDNRTPVVLHFANSDYYVSEPFNGSGGTAAFKGYTDSLFWVEYREVMGNRCYIAKEDIFLDFRMIQMDFLKNGAHTIIPVNQQPIDIVSGTEPHPDQGTVNLGGSGPSKGDKSAFSEWLAGVRKWVLIIALVVVIVVLIILFVIIKKFFTDNFVTRSIVGDYYDRKREQRQNEAERERAERDHRHAMELEREKQKSQKDKPKKEKKK